ncbi:MAG: (R,R)-butanediol dehydrogenase / meso-butanediol dehydrogenase / diacetyl reductase [Solirubrobacteraceae bacterium]|jgi:threonine dehydrogenase-like Zn-dependent dehydrogenase|nr:(R,R)-butanediol dehydrogenase / meso-butanediol dehydrogenase / diacetyl reductase [Solirubrobacteraceae bacterium]
MRAAQWVEPERLDLAEVDEPEPVDGQALVRVSECGICGSDLSSFKGGLGTRPGQVLGHEFSGTVLAAPGVEGLTGGERVTVRPLTPCGHCDRCLAGDVHLCEAGRGLDIGYGVSGAFADRVLVPRALLGQTIFKLPDAVSDRAGALVEPLAVALHATRLGEPEAGDVAVVFGLGIIGLGAVHWLKTMGASTVIAADPSELRRERARALGADVVVDPTSGSMVAAVAEITGPGLYGAGARADVVLECSGAAPAFTDAIRVARSGASLVIAALYKSKVELRPDRLVEKELTVRGSFAYKDEFSEVIAELERGAIDADALISHTFPLERIQEAFAIQADAAQSVKVTVTPDG